MNNEINSIIEINEMIENESAILVYFYNNNCASCISLRPKVEELIFNYFPKIKLIFVNSESNPEIPASFSVFSNPTLIIFLEGKEYRRESKYISIPQLSDSIRRHYELLFSL